MVAEQVEHQWFLLSQCGRITGTIHKIICGKPIQELRGRQPVHSRFARTTSLWLGIDRQAGELQRYKLL